jgi:hypothetical protein
MADGKISIPGHECEKCRHSNLQSKFSNHLIVPPSGKLPNTRSCDSAGFANLFRNLDRCIVAVGRTFC